MPGWPLGVNPVNPGEKPAAPERRERFLTERQCRPAVLSGVDATGRVCHYRARLPAPCSMRRRLISMTAGLTAGITAAVAIACAVGAGGGPGREGTRPNSRPS